MDKTAYLGNGEAAAIEQLYEQYLRNPGSVEKSWSRFFEGFEFARKNFEEPAGKEVPENVRKEFAVINLINLYRATGHLFTQTNPVRERRKYQPTLDEIELIGLSQADMDTVFHAGTELGIGEAKLRDIIACLKDTYCRSIGVEYMYIRSRKAKSWIMQKVEQGRNTPRFELEGKKRLLDKLTKAVVFENFLQTRFPGEKRFSLEGAEALIPALDQVVEKGSELGIKEFIIGMAHRGRLNVLSNIMGKTYEDIFTEFEGKEFEESLFDGDVKYHQGYSSNVITASGEKVHLSLTPNPSHLETVTAVAEGISRAKIDHSYNGDLSRLCPIIIHGDAAIAGQGIVYEVVQMSTLDAYKTGGTLHLVINNQVGFTTNYLDARSSTYCTDIAKVVLSPVFHVNGDDVEALAHTIRLAMEYRQQFHRDVFVDILCYRKYGHNEGDEPRFTQPLLYKAISSHPNPREIYMKKLSAEGTISQEEAKNIESAFRELLNERLNEAKQIRKTKVTSFLEGQWKGIRLAKDEEFSSSPDTSVKKDVLLDTGKKITHVPEGKKFFSKIRKLFSDRAAMLEGDGRLDWAMAELLAYGTLLRQGHSIRFSGQDVERGTFSHRHAVITLEDSEEQYIPLKQFESDKAKFEIYNSHLSEYGVLGFEYGYAMASPSCLTIWEAQFGDFSNCAQVVIDQYISAAEDKWRRLNGICLYLPHGYEGQGAEHSSARMERFLTLCAENNMYILNLTSPANFFHAIRRQLTVSWRKPMVVFTPKSLLRHPQCISPWKDLTKGGFREVLDDDSADPAKVKKLIFCTGKIWYDLAAEKQKRNAADTALVRLEQLYPVASSQLQSILSRYKNVKDYLWVQEEPENMGAWGYLLRTFKGIPLRCVARPESASPAAGSKKVHESQQADIVNRAFSVK